MQPNRAYFICTTPRSGSWLLALGLSASGVAGRPEEYFGADHRHHYLVSWGLAPQTPQSVFISRALAAGCGANGVFGAKVFWPHVMHLAQALGGGASDPSGLPAVLERWSPRLRYVRLKRRDRIAQAVSYYRAWRTREWWHDARPRERLFPRAPQRPDLDLIARIEHALSLQEAAWDQYFAHVLAEELLVVDYDDLVAGYHATLTQVLAHLGIQAPPRMPGPRLMRQKDAISDHWIECYRGVTGRGGQA